MRRVESSMRNPFDRYNYYGDDNWKKYLKIGLPVLVLIVLIVMIILLSTGVIKLPDFNKPSKDESPIYDPNKYSGDSNLKRYYSKSELQGREIAPRVYYEGTVTSCINRGVTIDMTYTITTSDGTEIEKKVTTTPAGSYVFDCETGLASSLSSLRAGDKVTAYVTNESDAVPFIFVKGNGYKAIKVETCTLVEDNGVKIISSDNSVKLVATYDSVFKSANNHELYYPAYAIRTGDIVIIEDDITSSFNKKYIAQDGSLSDDKQVSSSGAIKETGGVSTDSGVTKYDYIDYSTQNVFVIDNHLE